jgi:hypothetical protein
MTSSKTVEIVVPKTPLSLCILDDDPVQLDMLSAVIVEMGYEPIPTHDPEEALKHVKSGRRSRIAHSVEDHVQHILILNRR